MTQVGTGWAAHGCKSHSNLHRVVVYGDTVDQTEINNVDGFLGIEAVPENIHYSVDGTTLAQTLRPKFRVINQPNSAIRNSASTRRPPDHNKWTSGVCRSH